MVQDIQMNGVASYSQPVTISNLKRVNLFYGLNGTGKSTLSRFLAMGGKKEGKFSNCEPHYPTLRRIDLTRNFGGAKSDRSKRFRPRRKTDLAA